MRILSQDVLQIQDLPYEKTRVYLEKDGITVKGLFDGIVFELAKYSTESKARKAMEMLRVSFENYDWIKSTGNSEELKQVARMFNRDEFKKMTSSYFQFPTDDEVEV